MNLSSRYDSFDDPYCYAGTFVLKNKLDLQDYDALEAFEHESATAKGEEALPLGSFDPKHYCAIHRHLFGEVYDWAGQYRTVQTAKGGDMFCYPEYIPAQMDGLFAQLRDASFSPGSGREDFVAAVSSFLADLNAIHPFREGNGRTQLSFLFLLGHRAGHVLDMARIRPEPILCAMIASFNGKLNPLEMEISHLLT